MKKPSSREQSSEASRQSQKPCPKNGEKEGRWSFNLSSESLFSLGATAKARRVAYRTATGDLRFLPI